MVIPDPAMASGERVKLLDFGIAKLSLESGPGDQPLTRTGLFMGTPLYMSPEQCRGARNVDGKSDVYSLAVMFFQLIAGRPPFSPDNEVGVIAMHLTEPAPSVEKYAPKTAPKLVKLIARMLAKNKDERPTMQEVTEELLGKVASHASARLSGTLNPKPPIPSGRKAVPQSIMDLSEQVQESADSTVLHLPSNPSTLGKSVGEIDAPSSSQITPRRDAGLSREHSASLSNGSLGSAKGGISLALLLGVRRPARVLVGAGLGVSVLVVGLVLLLRTPSHPVVPPPPPPPPRQQVHWSLRSIPAKAEIVRETDGAVIGSTPWQHELAVDKGVETYLVRAPGYFDGRITLDRGRSAELTTTLKIDDDSPYWPKPRQRSGKGKGTAPKLKSHGKTLLVD